MRFSVSEYVRWEDIDAAGIINYQAYLRFFGLAEVELIVPSQVTARIQEAHQVLFHTLCDVLDPLLAAKAM